MSDIAIRVEGLSKKYDVGGLKQRHDTLRDYIMDSVTSLFRRNGKPGGGRHTIWALKDVSFEVKRGEVLGVIGHNGAGKSTLLKVLSRITQPSAGSADIYGRVGSLLEVGTGFHPELTGRENIYLNGAILGMKKAEIDRKFDEIVDFSGVEEFIDTPVKRYSSGMHVRLAFAVAAHLEPEILIIDEALAVGDAAFQKKCFGKMGEVAKEGRTVLLVTHNMGFISTLADRAVLLEKGKVKVCGETSLAISTYVGKMATQSSVDLRNHPNRSPRMSPALISARLTDGYGQDKDSFLPGEDLYLEIEYSCDSSIKLSGAGFSVQTATDLTVGSFNTYMCSPPPHRIPSQGILRFCLSSLQLSAGHYQISISIHTHPSQFYDRVAHAVAFMIDKTDLYGTGYIPYSDEGICTFKGSYEVSGNGIPEALEMRGN
jgi:lipopolysaccharide transport system ATP-binding protein